MLNKLSLLIKHPLILCLLSVVFLSLPWFGAGGYWSFVGFVPLLVLREVLQESGKKGFLWWTALVILLWHAVVGYWVSIATLVAAPGMPIGCMVMLWPAWAAFHFVAKNNTKILAYLILITGWVVFEWWCGYGEVNFPWLQLGNAWSQSVYAVQWYSFFGGSGGSVWVVLCNILIYEAISNKKVRVWAVGAVVVPIGVSLAMFWSYNEPKEEKISVAIIQPNIDAYEKFTTMGAWEQTLNILDLASQAPQNTELYVAPETALVSSINIQKTKENRDILAIQEFLKSRNSGGKFIVGASTHSTNRQHFNSALIIDTTKVEIYHKQKLVVAVETTPKWLQTIIGLVDLGGYIGSLTRGEGVEVYEVTEQNKVGVAICYESIYSELFSEWRAMGAGIMTIITNDGWWGNTHGHIQHMNFARLRAIENRCAIARSANTGISAIINGRGDVVESLGWDKRGVIVGEVAVNNHKTFYSIWGGIITRLCGFIFVLCLLYALSNHYRRLDRGFC